MTKKGAQKNPQVFIFDLDDTLYKEIDFVMSAFKHIDRLLVADHGLKPNKAYNLLMRSYRNGDDPFEALSRLLQLNGIEIPHAADWMIEEYCYHIPAIELEPTTRFTLKSMREMKIPMYIITDGLSITQRNKIRALGLDEYIPWENVFISEDLGHDKKTPLAFMTILERYRPAADKNEYVFVGANPEKDFLVANQYGCTSIQLTDDGRNIHPQDIVVDKNKQAKMHIKYFVELTELVDFWSFAETRKR